jgi:antibiotic biosynthesis monooxygenase (ABM) superfamily enzyme
LNPATFLCLSQDSTKILNKHGYISVFVLRQYQDFKQTWLHFCVCPKTVPRFQTNMVTFLCLSQHSTKISNKNGYISVFVPTQYQDFKQKWLHFCVCPKTVPRFQTNMVTFLCLSQHSTKISNKNGYISVFVLRQYQDFKQTWLHFCVCPNTVPRFQAKMVTFLCLS